MNKSANIRPDGSTVKTIFEFYKMTTALPEDFELMIQGESPPMEDVMRDWELFNDKAVIFRAIFKREIIEID